jgi:hypothetical protein
LATLWQDDREASMSRRYRDLALDAGRPREPWETVHHIDGNHADDHPDNLRVLPRPRAHALLHWYEQWEAKGVQHLWPLEEWLEPAGCGFRPRGHVELGDGILASVLRCG